MSDFQCCILGVCIFDVCSYSPKFTAYLARLLINYDYASMNWWERKTQVTATSGTQSSHTQTSYIHVCIRYQGCRVSSPHLDVLDQCSENVLLVPGQRISRLLAQKGFDGMFQVCPARPTSLQRIDAEYTHTHRESEQDCALVSATCGRLPLEAHIDPTFLPLHPWVLPMCISSPSRANASCFIFPSIFPPPLRPLYYIYNI